MPDPPTPSVRALGCALLVLVLVLAAPATAPAIDIVEPWGHAHIDDAAFQEPTGELLPSTQAFPRGWIKDPVTDGKDVRIRVFAMDANGDPLAQYAIDEGVVGKTTPFDRRLDVRPGVIAYMRFDFCWFDPGGSSSGCLEPRYLGRPAPPGPPGGDPPPPPGPADVDADGHATPADCDDRNSRVHPGAPELPGNGVDDDCAGSDRPGRVTADIQVGWSVQGARTRVKRLRVRNAPPGAAVDVACRGGGCPFKLRSFGVDGSGAVPLARHFERRLRRGAAIEVRVTAPNAIGKFMRYRMRRGRLPLDRQLCLPPGAAAPARC